MDNRTLKDLLYEQVARIGKAFSSPKRLEILEMLAQSEKNVETLAADVAIDVKLASAHLRALRDARLVASRRDGKYVLYRLSGADVAPFGVALRQMAEEHLVELRVALQQMMAEPGKLAQLTRADLVAKARKRDIVVLDVRPGEEFDAAHLPYARSIPLPELEKRLKELPKDRDVVAYCRGPFCLMSDEAVRLLQKKGYKARKIFDGVAEWLAAGLPLVRTPGDRLETGGR